MTYVLCSTRKPRGGGWRGAVLAHLAKFRLEPRKIRRLPPPVSAGGPRGSVAHAFPLTPLFTGPFPLACAGARVRACVGVSTPLGVLRMVSAAGALSAHGGTPSAHGGALSVVSSSLRAKCRLMRNRSSRSPLPTSALGLRLTPAHVCGRTSAHSRVHLHPPLPSSAPRVAAHVCPQMRQGWRRARARVDLFLCVCVPNMSV